MYSKRMPLALVGATHVRVTCDACRRVTAEVCARRELDITARIAAVPKFLAAGWHHDPGRHGRERSRAAAEREGNGRWYCAACAKQTHL